MPTRANLAGIWDRENAAAGMAGVIADIVVEWDYAEDCDAQVVYPFEWESSGHLRSINGVWNREAAAAANAGVITQVSRFPHPEEFATDTTDNGDCPDPTDGNILHYLWHFDSAGLFALAEYCGATRWDRDAQVPGKAGVYADCIIQLNSDPCSDECGGREPNQVPPMLMEAESSGHLRGFLQGGCPYPYRGVAEEGNALPICCPDGWAPTPCNQLALGAFPPLGDLYEGYCWPTRVCAEVIISWAGPPVKVLTFYLPLCFDDLGGDWEGSKVVSNACVYDDGGGEMPCGDCTFTVNWRCNLVMPDLTGYSQPCAFMETRISFSCAEEATGCTCAETLYDQSNCLDECFLWDQIQQEPGCPCVEPNTDNEYQITIYGNDNVAVNCDACSDAPPT